MNIRILHNKGFSLLEILLASIIFIITVGGVFVTLIAMRRPVADSESALTASVFGKQVLEALRSQVDAGSFYNSSCTNPISGVICGDFSLFLGQHEVNLTTLNNYGLNWPGSALPGVNTCQTNPCLSYTVTCADDPTGATYTCSPSCNPTTSNCNFDLARRVDLSINWPDAT